VSFILSLTKCAAYEKALSVSGLASAVFKMETCRAMHGHSCL
jgi:hypothetical protein